MLKAEGLHLGTRLQDFSIDLEEACLAAVVGPNGAGKSTLLQALAGLLKVEGKVHWNGQPLAKIPFLERGRRLAWVGQETHAEFGFPVREVVAQGRFAWGSDGQGVQEAMTDLDILHLADRSVTELSAGERHRVFLARALVTQAPIQLWDEPTASLDVRHSLEVLRLARTLAVRGKLVMVSLHDLRMAYRFDKVAILDQGRLVGFGSPHDVLNRDMIRSVFRVEATFVTSFVPEILGTD